MKGRYLALTFDSAADLALVDRIVENGKAQCLKCALRSQRLAVLVDADLDYFVDAEGQVAIIGLLFTRDDTPSRVRSFSDRDRAAILARPDSTLISKFWGNYVALLDRTSADQTQVLRDPSGSVSCFTGNIEQITFLCSDVELIEAMGLARPRPDWDQVVRYLAFPLARGPRTCLQGISSIMPGEYRKIGASREERAGYAWSPSNFARHDEQPVNPDTAARLLAHEVERCVGAFAAQSNSILLELSGGLDSSILGVCLAKTTASFTCVNLASSAPGGDERTYARSVAEAARSQLIEVVLDPSSADIFHRPPIRSPYPNQEVLREINSKAITAIAANMGADAFFSGGGGDNVFCFLPTASPAADVLRSEGPSRQFASTVSDIANLFRCTIWQAGYYAVRKAFWAPSNYLRGNKNLLQNLPDLAVSDIHPWIREVDQRRPGKAEHIASIAAALWSTDAAERSQFAPMRYPLLAQPVVELCLGIPSWYWVRGGRNRSLARDAFSTSLPANVLNRRTKGDLTDLIGEVYRRNILQLRELLLDGLLSSSGYLDRRRTEAVLNFDGMPPDSDYTRIVTLAKAEVWARNWSMS